MKKIVIYLVCITIFLQLGFQAFQIVGRIIQHKIQIEVAIKNGLYNSQLIHFTSTQLQTAQWDGSKEFILNHQKYDLVETQQTTNGLIYICINDKVEQVLLKALEKAAQKSKSQQSASKNAPIYCHPALVLVLHNCPVFIETTQTSINSFLLEGYPHSTFQPPSYLV